MSVDRAKAFLSPLVSILLATAGALVAYGVLRADVQNIERDAITLHAADVRAEERSTKQEEKISRIESEAGGVKGKLEIMLTMLQEIRAELRDNRK